MGISIQKSLAHIIISKKKPKTQNHYFKQNAELYSVAGSNICLRERIRVMVLEQVCDNFKGAMLTMVTL